MKSIIEQASSIMKAIEKAWNQAEQPKEFSIKIFEKEERNFFGMTSKPAKIGIFFGDKPITHEKQPQKPRPEIKECRPSSFASPSHKASVSAKATTDITENREEDFRKIAPQPKSSSSAKAMADTTPAPKQQTPRPEPRQQQIRPAAQPKVQSSRPQHAAEKVHATTATTTATEEKPRRIPATWNDAMIAATHNWLKKTLDLMNMKTVAFNSEIAGKNLKLTFNAPLIADATHEKQLFRSFAHLIMSSLRNQYKQEIKDLKVILIRPE